jgi:hypothetical protein
MDCGQLDANDQVLDNELRHIARDRSSDPHAIGLLRLEWEVRGSRGSTTRAKRPVIVATVLRLRRGRGPLRQYWPCRGDGDPIVGPAGYGCWGWVCAGPLGGEGFGGEAIGRLADVVQRNQSQGAEAMALRTKLDWARELCVWPR